MDKDYQNISLLSEINKKINTLNKTRDNRINLNKRLKKYNEKWRVVFFFLNIEAVVFVIFTLAGGSIINRPSSGIFTIISGVFTIYVILSQYYVNQLNYGERALKVHYHQLDIEDLILKLKTLILQREYTTDSKEVISRFNIIMEEYQRILKNNENHDDIDNKLREITELNKNVSDNSTKKSKENINSTEEESCLKVKKSDPIDLSIDNVFLTFNISLLFILFLSFLFY